MIEPQHTASRGRLDTTKSTLVSHAWTNRRRCQCKSADAVAPILFLLAPSISISDLLVENNKSTWQQLLFLAPTLDDSFVTHSESYESTALDSTPDTPPFSSCF